MPDHPSTDELADIAMGMSGTPAAEHVADCAQCRAELAELAEVTALLGSDEVESIPAAVAARLDAALTAEVERERQGRLVADQQEALLRAAKKTELGSFGPNLAIEKKDFTPDGRHAVAARNRARRQET